MKLINEIDDYDISEQIPLDKLICLIKETSECGEIFVELTNDYGYYDDVRPVLRVYEK